MPTYEYACTSCGHRMEAVQSFSDPALTTCPVCQGALRKVFGNVGIVLKGSGFYKNDSRSSGRSNGCLLYTSVSKSHVLWHDSRTSGTSGVDCTPRSCPRGATNPPQADCGSMTFCDCPGQRLLAAQIGPISLVTGLWAITPTSAPHRAFFPPPVPFGWTR